MKNYLLLVFVMTFSFAVRAQQKTVDPSNQYNLQNNKILNAGSQVKSIPGQSSPQDRVVPGRNQSLVNTASLDTLGSSSTGLYGCAGKSRCNLWYDWDLNTISFIHRVRPLFTGDLTSNNLRYDVSINGGLSWALDQGPIFSDNSSSYLVKYPLGLIANPQFTSVTDSAVEAFTASENSLTSGYALRGEISGFQQLSLTHQTQYIDTVSNYVFLPEDMFTVKFTGDIWEAGKMFFVDTALRYMDSILVKHGIWNSFSRKYDFFNKAIYAPTPISDSAYFRGPLEVNIAFDDAGGSGYIALITNNDPSHAVIQDSTFYLDVYKTTNGGLSWDPIHIDIQTAVDTLLAHNSSLRYGTTSDLDIVVDVNSNLHILTGITASDGFSTLAKPGQWGMFDIFTMDLGITWKAVLLDKPNSFRGVFGDGVTFPFLIEDNRPFASRNWNGDMLFFSWFDTDTMAWLPRPDHNNNMNPDLHTIGYDTNTQLWTDALNLTYGTDADGVCTFGNGSYYVIDSGFSNNVFSIPVVFMNLMGPLNTSDPVNYWYVENANVDMSTATHSRYSQTTILSSFISPASVPTVWPGDCNYDLVVNNYDFLYMALAYNGAGPARPGASNNWVAQLAADWTTSFPGGLNHKHADTNGDGIVNDNDSAAIYLNYGRNHPFRRAQPDQVMAVGDFSVVANNQAVNAGDTVVFDIHMANSTVPISSLYGIAFSLLFDETLIDTSQVHFNFSSSVLGTINTDMKSFEKGLYSSGKIDVALSRIDHTNATNVGGIIGTLSIVTSSNFIGSSTLYMIPADVRGIDIGGTPVVLNSVIDSVVITGIQPVQNVNEISLFPNPAHDKIVVRSMKGNIDRIELFDSNGKKVFSDFPEADKAEISTIQFAAGIYTVSVLTDKKVIHKKVQIVR